MAVQQRSHGQGYTMPAKQLHSAADVLAHSRAVYLRMRAAPAIVPRLMPPTEEPSTDIPVEPEAPAAPPPEPAYGCPLDMLLQPSWRFLVSLAALKGGVTSDDIIGPQRFRPIAKARHYACYLIAVHTSLSLPHIGRNLGGRDHKTIHNSLGKHPALDRPRATKFRRKHISQGNSQ
jgi:hypothetical protein